MSQWASLPEPRTSSPDFGDEHDELIDDDDAGATLAARHGDATRASQAIHASMSSATISNSSARKRKLPPVTDAGHGASKRPRGPDVLNYDPGRYPGRASGHASAHAQPSNSTSTLGSASKAQKPAAAVAAHGQRRHTIAQDVIVLSDSDDNDDRGGLPPDSHRRKTIAGTENVVLRGPATHQQAGSHGGAAALVIDLTLDSDDDAVLPSSVPPSTSRLPARSADYDPELEHDSPLPMDVVVEMRKESGPSLPTPGPSSTRTTARPLSSATSHGVESARAAAGNPPDKPSEKPIEGEEHLGKNQKPTYEVDKILKHWSGPFKITDDDLLPRWEFNCKFCSSIRTFPRRKSCATYSDEHPRPMGIMGLRQHLRDKHPAVLRKAIDGVEPMDSDNDAVLPSSVPPSTSLLPARSADPEPEPDSPLPMDVVAETRKESEPSLPTPGLSSTRSTARPLSSATSHRVESARAPAGSLPDKPSEKPIEGEQGENRTRTYEVDEILKHWSGPFKITDDDLLPRWEFNCKFCPSIRTFPRRKSCATYFDEQPCRMGISNLRQHLRDKHPAVLRKAMDGVEPMDSDNDAVLPSSVPPSTSLLPAPSADPQPEPEPDSPLPMDVVAETRKENEPSLPTPGLSSTRSTARPLSSATSHHVESARAAAGSPPDKPNEKPIESEETHAYKVDEILKHWSTPIKMIDTHFLPRWKFNCKFCSSTRTFTRTESCATYFDEHPRPRGIYNLRQHFVEMHPAVLSEGDGPGANAPQPVVAATTTKPVKRAKNYILKFWSVPRKATSNTPRWAFDCKLCSSTRTVPRDERCETFFDEKPQPDLLGLYQHTDERHPDAGEKLAALEVPQSSQSDARARGQLKFSRYWSDERATVDAGGRLRWAFDCKFCESTQTVARTAGVEVFYDEHPRPAVGNLMTHTKLSHPDADEKLKVDYVEHVARHWDGPVKVGEQQWKFKCKRCPTLFHVAGSDDWQDEMVVRQLWWLVRHMHVEHLKAMDTDGSTSTAASPSRLSHEQPKSTPQAQRVPAAATNAPQLPEHPLVQATQSTHLPEDATVATSRSRPPPTPPPDTHPTPDTRASTSAKSLPVMLQKIRLLSYRMQRETRPLRSTDGGSRSICISNSGQSRPKRWIKRVGSAGGSRARPVKLCALSCARNGLRRSAINGRTSSGATPSFSTSRRSTQTRG
ncbi:hypothetical protein EXIGLDRAFT_343349 [Exidia glandulosa HHB12029]|uniref:Uncharacterized protein n=1 Tax=Exidia glandulosa HHB12029 TaxID=1314781 RepID=A0A165LI11_EXIGL|nr:hypothetical protein EXIGLDRAFT_343349 [Exidia glandulosa HHB12029]